MLVPVQKKFIFNMKDFTDKRWITTDTELRNLLQQCRNCYSSTLKGTLVLPYNEMETLNVSKLKYTLIINTNNVDSNTSSVGHWIVCHVNVLSKIVLLHDSLNEIEKCHPKVILNIQSYCKKRNLKLYILKFRTQEKKNLNCGLHSLWFTHKSHKYNSNALMKMKKIFDPYTVIEREHFIMNEKGEYKE